MSDAMNGIVVRSGDVIAAEINLIKKQTAQSVMRAAVQIGMLLHEAKIAVGHGNWANWLYDNVDYSEKTAQRFMKLADAYGQNLLAEADGDEYSQAIADMLPTKALILAQLAPAERREYIESHDVENESTRKMKEEIAKLTEEKDQLSMDLLERDKALAFKDEQLKSAAEDEKRHIEQTEAKVRSEFKDTEAKLKKDISAANKKADDLKKKLEEAQKAPVAQIDAKEVEALKKQLSAVEASLKQKDSERAKLEEEFRRKLRSASNPAVQKLLFSVETWQKASVELVGAYSALLEDEETKDTAKRIREAILKQCAAIENSI